MKRTFLITLFKITLLISALSQNQAVVDSIQRRLSEKDYESIKIKIDLLNEYAYQYRNAFKDSAKIFALEALDLSTKNKYNKGKGDALMRLGTVSRIDGDCKAAVQYFNQALPIRQTLNDTVGVGAVYNNLANCYRDFGDLLNVKKHYKLALANYKTRIGTDHRKGIVYNNLGSLENRLGNIDLAILYFDSSLVIKDSLGDERGKAIVHLNKGNTFTQIPDEASALSNLDTALKFFIKVNDLQNQFKAVLSKSALYFNLGKYTEADAANTLALSFQENINQLDLGRVYSNKGNIARVQKNFNQALNYFSIAKENIDSSFKKDYATILFNEGKVYLDQQRFSEAGKNFQDALKLLENVPLVQLQSKLLSNLSLVYAQQQNLEEAFALRKESDEFYKKLSLENLKAISLEGELTKEKLTSTNLKITADNQQLQLRNKQMWIYGLTSLILLILGIFSLGVVNYLKDQKMKEQEREKDRQITDMLRDFDLKKAYSRLEGEEKARKHIAQELHDGIGGLLSTMKLNFSAMETGISDLMDDTPKQYQKAASVLDRTVAELRKVSHDLKSGTLNYIGLKEELRDLTETIKTSNKLQVEFLTHNWEDQSFGRVDLQLFRIVQELVGNVLKHSGANKLSLQLNHFDNLINLVVEDNGKGFDLQKAKEKNGLGIKGIEARVHELGGTINIDTRPGYGTTVNIDVPIDE